MQYFATTPNNGMFGPSAKLVHLSTTRPSSATARPLSSLSGRASRSEERPPSRARQSNVPLPSATPQRRTPARGMLSPGVRTPHTFARPSGLSATPQATRTTSMPRSFRRPTSAAGHARPTSVLRTPRREPSGFSFDAPAPASVDDPSRRQGLLEQMDLENRSATALGSADDTVPMVVHEQVAEELKNAQARLQTLKVSSEDTEALREQTETLRTELATVRAEMDKMRTESEGDAKLKPMVAAWDRERAELSSRIEELQGAGREAIAVFEHQLDLAATEQQGLRTHIQELETQLAKDPRDASVSATDIDLANLREQNAHLTDKVAALEEELAEAKDKLDAANDAAKKAATAHDAAAAGLQEKIRAAEQESGEQADAARRAEAEVKKLEAALQAEKAAHERERQEIESMRAAPHDEQLQAQLKKLEASKKELEDVHAKEIAELESLVESRIFREDELETEMEQLRKERDEALAKLKE